VTVTGGVRSVHSRLHSQPRWANLTQEDVLIWREEEQSFTEEMARIHRKPQLLVPNTSDVESGFRLLFEPGWMKAYLSYPMQHVEAGNERGLDTFREKLQERLV